MKMGCRDHIINIMRKNISISLTIIHDDALHILWLKFANWYIEQRHNGNRKNVKSADKVFRKQTLESIDPLSI